jgi:putative FmdB family regulatory protein
MIYPYRCPVCSFYDEVFKPSSEASTPQVCPHCFAIMNRVWTPTAFKMNGGYKVPAGQIEIGDESPIPPKKLQSYDIPHDLSAYPELNSLSG